MGSPDTHGVVIEKPTACSAIVEVVGMATDWVWSGAGSRIVRPSPEQPVMTRARSDSTIDSLRIDWLTDAERRGTNAGYDRRRTKDHH